MHFHLTFPEQDQVLRHTRAHQGPAEPHLCFHLSVGTTGLMSPELHLPVVPLPYTAALSHPVTSQYVCASVVYDWSSPSSLLTPRYMIFNVSIFLTHIHYPAAFCMMLRTSFFWQRLLHSMTKFPVFIPNMHAKIVSEITNKTIHTLSSIISPLYPSTLPMGSFQLVSISLFLPFY